MINISNYSFKYSLSGENTKNTIENITISLEEGGFYLICGASGSGKTTLLRQMVPSRIPDGTATGTILIDGKKPGEMTIFEEATTIGYVGQDPDAAIVTDYVWHELAFGLENLGLNNEQIKRKVAEMAQFFGITQWYDKKTNELSGGQKQILSLASIMVMQPKYLLLDEPTAQLDPMAAADFIHTLRRLNEELGVTVILSEHRLEEVFDLSQKVIYLEEGKLGFFGEPKECATYFSSSDNHMELGLPSFLRVAKQLQISEATTFARVRRNITNDKKFNIDYINKLPRIREDLVQKIHKNPEIIQVQELAFSYGNKQVLKKVNLSLHKGEIFSLLGGNGAGKSTLLRLITGSLSPEEGRILYEGKNLRKNPVPLGEGGVVLLPQNPKLLFSGISVWEELPDEEWLSYLELSDLKDAHPYDLSGGQMQRLALGKLLALHPKVLLLDEPTKGLDPYYKKELGELLQKLCHKEVDGITILLVTHDVEFTAEYADCCGLLFDGELSALQEAREFLAGNYFYTTGVNKLMREVAPELVTMEEVVSCIMES